MSKENLSEVKKSCGYLSELIENSAWKRDWIW